MLVRYLDFTPAIAPPSDCAPTAAMVGRVVAGPGLVLRDYATLRADGEWVRIGANGYFGERATVHIADSALPASVGDDVTVGRYALVHACTVEDRAVVGDTAVVMDGAHVGAGALITAGSLVPPRKRLRGGWLYDGNPATPVRPIGADELAAARSAIRARMASAHVSASDLPPLDMGTSLPSHGGARAPEGAGPWGTGGGSGYIAPTAMVAGEVAVADDAGIYFGCAVLAGGSRIDIGPRTNVQDNSLLITDAARGRIVLGADVTIGHNVRIGPARIGDHALIGMGSQIGDGVVVEAGGCVGARAWVEPGTVVAAGWIWAGRPARAFRELRPQERATFARAAAIYVRYGAAYRSGRNPDE